MKLSTALFSSVLAICCTVGLVNGQVKFPDGTEQTTAFTGRTSIPTANAFRVYLPNGTESFTRLKLADPVPSGQELVILFDLSPYGLYGAYLSARTGGINPNYLTHPDATPHNYPDGTIVVDEGQELWIEINDGDGTLGGFSNYFDQALVLGYYRDK